MVTRTVKIGSFALGVNNRLEATQLDVVLPDRSRGTYLYGADNVDINEKGYLKRRAGQTPSIVGGRPHSIWSDPPYAEAFAVVAGNLERLVDGAPLSRTIVRTAMPNAPLSYSRGADGDVYWSNGQDIRRIAHGVDLPIQTEPLLASPTLTPGVGALPAGQYLIAFTAQTANGESPATPVRALDLPAGSGFTYAAAERVNVYMSGPNGDILTLQQAGQFTGTVLGYDDTGRRAETLNTALMPAGQIVRHYNGRMLVARGNVLLVSEPYNYGIYRPSQSYFPFPARITVVEPTDNGVYLVADKTYWIADFYAGTPQECLPYGAVPGTSGRSPNGEEVFWQSDNGLVVGDKNMSIKNVQEEALAMATAASGASLHREKNGMVHIVSTRSGADSSVATATSFMEAEVVRRGTQL